MQLVAMLIAGLTMAVCCGGTLGCQIAINTPGVLKLSADGKTLSTANGGVPALLALSDFDLLASTTVTISNVRLDVTPAGFATGSVTYAANYTATWLLATRSGTLASPSFTVPAALNVAVALELHNTITSATGFAQGNYTSKTTVQCS